MTTETYFSGDITRQMSSRGVDAAAESVSLILQKFPWFKAEDYYSISTPAFHEVLGEDVITCCLPLQATDTLVGPGYALGNRKFCLSSGTSFLRLYKIYTGETPAWMPPSCKIMFIGDNHAEYGRPFNSKATEFHDLYFSGAPDEVEAAFNLPMRRGAYETFYGVTIKDGAPARVKQYVYDEQSGFSDWDVIYLLHQKRLSIGR